MEKKVNLLEGNISSALVRLALPIMGTSLIQMAYNLTDIMWIGRVGAESVTAVGTAGFYLWIGTAMAILPKMGGQVRTGFYLGAGKIKEAREVVSTTLKLTVFMMFIYSLFLYMFNGPLIDFFKLHNPSTVADTRGYLYITTFGIIFAAINVVMTGLITANGNSKTSFMANSVGLIVNIILDPILIFGLGPFDVLGVNGAAYATVIAQIIVSSILVLFAMKDTDLFHKLNIFKLPSLEKIKEIVKIGFPTSLQSIAFALIAMVISRIVVDFGDDAVAIQRVGTQLESLSWMTADGFATAINAFIAQNYGARKIDRAKEGYRTAVKIISVWGVFVTLLLFLGAKPLFSIFLKEQELIPLGVDYLRILAVSQLFMCYEIITGGAFGGYGQTMIPSAVGVTLNAARIPLAFFLAYTCSIGLNGVWWAISVSSIAKGIMALILFRIFMHRKFVKETI